MPRVFIENEARLRLKNYYDEKTLEWKREVQVSRPYPFPYGFIIGTTGEDHCSVDCFVLTRRRLKRGQVVTCEVVGLMEQIEDGAIDHNVLAVPVGDVFELDSAIRNELTSFVLHVFDHVSGKETSVGRFLGPEAAEAHVRVNLDEGNGI